MDDPTVNSHSTEQQTMSASISAILEAPPAERLTLTELARQENVSPSTTWRWATKGEQHIRLPSVLIGSARMTTRAAFLAWCEERTARANQLTEPAAPTTQSESDEAKRAERAERELAQLGLTI